MSYRDFYYFDSEGVKHFLSLRGTPMKWLDLDKPTIFYKDGSGVIVNHGLNVFEVNLFLFSETEQKQIKSFIERMFQKNVKIYYNK